MIMDGVTYRVDLLQLPTVVESYKTYDDTNLVKTGDIGQVGATDQAWSMHVVAWLHNFGGHLTSPRVHACMQCTQVLLVGGQIPADQVECEDGVTPPMRKARQRHFKQLPKVDPKVRREPSCVRHNPHLF
jgi:transcription initiation factor TFIID subunit 7